LGGFKSLLLRQNENLATVMVAGFLLLSQWIEDSENEDFGSDLEGQKPLPRAEITHGLHTWDTVLDMNAENPPR
jgi:hypothetical protein